MFVSLLLRMSVESTLFRTLPNFSAELVVPAPVTTTSPSWNGFSARLKSRVMFPPVSSTCAFWPV